MSLFDYDTRPATPGVVLVDTGTSAAAYRIRDFLSRNSCQYEWVDITDSERVRALLGDAELDARSLPVCVLPDGTQLSPATLEQVAAGLGMMSGPSRSEYDLTIVGAGPAGLAAAVYAASEGLRALVLEAIAPGGQAGTTSMIENYLGFPNGISGSELATRAVAQARRFGAEILLARPLVGISPEGLGVRSASVRWDDSSRTNAPAGERGGVETSGSPRNRRAARRRRLLRSRTERSPGLCRGTCRRRRWRELCRSGGRTVLPLCDEGDAPGPRARPRRLHVEVSHRRDRGYLQCRRANGNPGCRRQRRGSSAGGSRHIVRKSDCGTPARRRLVHLHRGRAANRRSRWDRTRDRQCRLRHDGK